MNLCQDQVLAEFFSMKKSFGMFGYFSLPIRLYNRGSEDTDMRERGR